MHGASDVNRRPSDYSDDPSEFPKSMNEKEIKGIIKTAVEDGQVQGERITYSGPEVQQYGIGKLVVIREYHSGRIRTAYPEQKHGN